MFELLIIISIVLAFYLFIKVVFFLVKAGIFIAILPLKIILSILVPILLFIFISIFTIPIVLAGAIIMLPLILLIGGVIFVLR